MSESQYRRPDPNSKFPISILTMLLKSDGMGDWKQHREQIEVTQCLVERRVTCSVSYVPHPKATECFWTLYRREELTAAARKAIDNAMRAYPQQQKTNE
jgi:hypothetical protein